MEFLVGFVLVLGQVKWEEFLKTRVLFFILLILTNLVSLKESKLILIIKCCNDWANLKDFFELSSLQFPNI